MKKKVLGTLLCTLVSASMLFGCASTKEQDQVNDQGQTDTPDTDTGSGTDETNQAGTMQMHREQAGMQR